MARTSRKGRNCLPDLTFSRASNNAFFRFLLSNLSTQENKISGSIQHAAEEEEERMN